MSVYTPIEDLDPGRPARTRRWEHLLGLVLVVGLAGFGLGQWWMTARQYDAFQAGGRAVAARDWDAAAVAYRAAGDFRDAPQRAAGAAAQAAERNRQYAAAGLAVQHDDWLGAFAAITRLWPIAPAYRDTAALSATMTAQIYTATLSGTVLLRPAAGRPGLYAYGPAGPRWLTSSDAQSQVWARCADGSILFDAPAGVAGAPHFDPSTGFPSRASLAGRRLLVAWPDGILRQALQLDPSAFEQFQCTPAGVWGLSYAGRPRPAAVARENDEVLVTAYQPWGAPAAVTPAVPGPAWDVKGVTPDGRRLLLLDARDLSNRGGVARLDLAQADGSAPRLVATLTGLPGLAQFSPDGRWALLSQTQLIGGTLAAIQTALLLDLTAPGEPPRVLLTSRWDRTAPETTGFLALFVSQGPHSGQVLLVRSDGDTRVAEFWDPARQDSVSWGALGAAGPIGFFQTDAGDGAVLLDWPASAQPLDGRVRQLLYIDSQNRSRFIHLPSLAADEDLDGAWVRAGFLVYATRGSGSSVGPRTVHSIPLAAAGAPVPPAATIFQGTAGMSAGAGDIFRFAPTLLTYLTPDGALHARRYDGSPDDVIVAHLGAQALFAAPWTVP